MGSEDVRLPDLAGGWEKDGGEGHTDPVIEPVSGLVLHQIHLAAVPIVNDIYHISMNKQLITKS